MSGDSRAANSALETINAAATAIALADTRVPQATVRKRRWFGWLSIYWCFGTPRNRKRIGHAVLVPEPMALGTSAPRVENPSQPPPIILPFIAPPSSPASFLQSEPPSAAQSPVGLLSLTSVSASMYSPGGPSSIFAIGPYAHETQLVSPPVFSTFTTEPSTAPFTPPPESVHLTTPSSPEVPFAQLLDPKFQSRESCQRFPIFHNEFQSYHLQPGSPVGHLISPSSGISGSGTSSPFLDSDFAGSHFLEFRTGNPPKLLNLDKLSTFDWGSRQGSGTLTPDAANPAPASEIAPQPHPDTSSRNGKTVPDQRVSFELKTEDDARSVENKNVPLDEAVLTSLRDTAKILIQEKSNTTSEEHECRIGETSNDAPEKAPSSEENIPWHQKHRSITLGSSKDFNFDSVDPVDSHKPDASSDWWANEKVAGNETSSTSQNWSFFPYDAGKCQLATVVDART